MNAPIRVLVVDDSAVVRQVVSEILSAAPGIEVVGTASDPLFAMAKMRRDWPDVLVLDVEMPRMDGLTLIKSLRSMPQYATTPILMLTTESSDAMKSQGRAAGATGWLVKPFDPQKLIEVVRKVIG